MGSFTYSSLTRKEGAKLILEAEVESKKGDASFQLSPEGVLTYTWKKGTEVIQRGSSSQLIFNPVTPENAGNYTVEVEYNLYGQTVKSTNSNTKVITVTPKSDSKITVNTNGNFGRAEVVTFGQEATGSPTVTKKEGTTVRIAAVPKDGYKFENWTKDSKVYSNDPYTTAQVEADNTTYTANFEKIGNSEIDVKASPSGAGDVSIGDEGTSGNYQNNSALTIKATPKNEYVFKEWRVKYDGKNQDEFVSNDAETTIVVKEKATYTAYFESKASEKVEISVTAFGPNNAGTVTGFNLNKTYYKGDHIKVSAKANPGFKFVNWTRKDKAPDASDPNKELGSVVTETQDLDYTIEQHDVSHQPVQLIANFKGDTVLAEASSNNSTHGSASISKDDLTDQAKVFSEVGQTITLNAKPSQGYGLNSWKLNGKNITTQGNHYTIRPEDVKGLTEETENLESAPVVNGTKFYRLKFEAQFTRASSPAPSPGPSNPNPSDDPPAPDDPTPDKPSPDEPVEPGPDEIVVETEKPTEEEVKLPEGVELTEPEDFKISIVEENSDLTVDNSHQSSEKPVKSGKKTFTIEYDKKNYSFIKWLVTFVEAKKSEVKAAATEEIYEYPSETLVLNVEDDVILKPVFVAKNDSAVLSFNANPAESGTIKYKSEEFGTEDYPFGTQINVVKGDTLEVTALKNSKYNGTFDSWLVVGNDVTTTDKAQTNLKLTVGKNATNLGVTAVYKKVEEAPQEVQTTRIYRLYNSHNGEHLFTPSVVEYEKLKSVGWKDENTAWMAPKEGEPVYRLYNPVLNNHLYTKDTNEVRVLTSKHGWVQDYNGKPIFYSGGDVPVYRLYNKDLKGMHLFTTDTNEYNVLPSHGWQQENIGLKAVSKK